jgi:hypothetical protein
MQVTSVNNPAEFGGSEEEPRKSALLRAADHRRRGFVACQAQHWLAALFLGIESEEMR